MRRDDCQPFALRSRLLSSTGLATPEKSFARDIFVRSLLMLALLACSDNMGSTAQFGTYEHASISGVALSDDGTPLDSVSVSFDVPPDRGAYNGGPTQPRTGGDGAFILSMNRVAHPPGFTPPVPDTLTVRLVGSYLGSPGTDPSLRDTAYVLVRFVPKEEQAPRSTVTLRMTVP